MVLVENTEESYSLIKYLRDINLGGFVKAMSKILYNLECPYCNRITKIYSEINEIPNTESCKECSFPIHNVLKHIVIKTTEENISE